MASAEEASANQGTAAGDPEAEKANAKKAEKAWRRFDLCELPQRVSAPCVEMG